MSLRKTIVASLVLCLLGGPAIAEVDIGLSIDKDGIKGFHLAIGEHFGVAQKEIVVVQERNIPDEDLPVVFFLARHADVKSAVIIKMRLRGHSWMDIALHFGLTAEAFYVPLKKPGPPYGKAWGHFKKNKRREWKTIRLTDAEITAYVNLNFISGHYGCSVDDVAKMRSSGKRFVTINAEVKKKKNRSTKPFAAEEKPGGRPEGKGKNKKK